MKGMIIIFSHMLAEVGKYEIVDIHIVIDTFCIKCSLYAIATFLMIHFALITLCLNSRDNHKHFEKTFKLICRIRRKAEHKGSNSLFGNY